MINSLLIHADKLCPHECACRPRAAGQLHDRAQQAGAEEADLAGDHAAGALERGGLENTVLGISG